MCRILIYGCPAVVKQISSEGSETLISCKQHNSTSEDVKEENFNAEIHISHINFPQIHKIQFVHELKEEKPEVTNDQGFNEELVGELLVSHLDVKYEDRYVMIF